MVFVRAVRGTRGRGARERARSERASESESDLTRWAQYARAVHAGGGDKGSRRDAALDKFGSRCDLLVFAATLLTLAGVAAQRQCALVPAGNHANNCGATTNGTQVTFRGVFALLRHVTLERMRGAQLRLADLAAG